MHMNFLATALVCLILQAVHTSYKGFLFQQKLNFYEYFQTNTTFLRRTWTAIK